MSGNKQNYDLFIEIFLSNLDKIFKILPKKYADLKDQSMKNESKNLFTHEAYFFER